jgi:hypothetical protein
MGPEAGDMARRLQLLSAVMDFVETVPFHPFETAATENRV